MTCSLSQDSSNFDLKNGSFFHAQHSDVQLHVGTLESLTLMGKAGILTEMGNPKKESQNDP